MRKAVSLNPDNPRLGGMQEPWNAWVAVKDLKLSYYIGETILITIYTHYGNFI